MSLFNRKKKFHFVGIGGIGMSGLAEILLHLGHEVSGSDRQLSEITDYLAEKGARIFAGHAAQNVPHDAHFLVYSSAVPSDNPELQQARRLGIACMKRAELLGQLFNRHFGIAVAGTHGKTTTTSMLGHILLKAQLDPTIVVGGRLHNLMTNARLGHSPYMVTEADEYDRSFLTLHPRVAVITNLEADHLDIYRDLEDLRQTFLQFANQVTFDGLVVACADDPNIKTLLPQIGPTVLTYGLKSEADFTASIQKMAGHTSYFKIYKQAKELAQINLQLPGEHNVLNALAAFIVALELEIPVQSIVAALQEFKGVERRFDILFNQNHIMVVDDYAHHPTEVAATLKAARKGWQRRLIAVFQPHLFSRTRDFYKEFAGALSLADFVLIAKIYPAREQEIAGISGKLISDVLGEKAQYIEQTEDLLEYLKNSIKPNDMVLFLGAGDIHYTALKFADWLRNNTDITRLSEVKRHG